MHAEMPFPGRLRRGALPLPLLALAGVALLHAQVAEAQGNASIGNPKPTTTATTPKATGATTPASTKARPSITIDLKAAGARDYAVAIGGRITFNCSATDAYRVVRVSEQGYSQCRSAPFTFPPLFEQWGKNRLCVLDRHYAGTA